MAYSGDKKRTYQLEWLNERRNAWITSQGGRCVFCSTTDELQVDHINAEYKTMNPTHIWSKRQEVREAELANCQVLCSVCHRVKSSAASFTGHGTDSTYKARNCRCELCRAAHAAKARAYRANNK